MRRFTFWPFAALWSFAAFLLVTGYLGFVAAQPAQRERQVLQKPVVRKQGRIVERRAVEMRKFDRPVTSVPALRPPVREGFSWHWHPHYGWIAIAVASAPREVLLPVTYQLPAQVTYYELPAATNDCQLTCPHCGQPITVSIR
jgi:hypothetical protein